MRRFSWRALKFYWWMRLGMLSVSGMSKNAELHKRTSVANRLVHTVRSGKMEIVVSWSDLTKPAGFSLEEEAFMRQYVQQKGEADAKV